MNRTRSRRSVRPWYVGTLAAIAIAVIVFGVTQLGTTTSSARTSSETVAAADGVVQTTVSGSGNLEPGVDDDVNFATSGTLKSIDVKVGEHVKKGQLLATIDTSSAELTLEEAETTLKSAEDSLTSTEDETFDSSTDESSSTSSDSSTSSGTSVSSTSSDTSGATATAASAAGSAVPGKRTTTTTQTTTTQETASEKRAAAKQLAAEKAAEKKQAAKEKAAKAKAKAAAAEEVAKEKAAFDESRATAVAQAQEQVQSDEATVTSDRKAVSETNLYAPAAGTIASLADDTVGESVSSGTDSSVSSSTSSSTSSDTASGTSSTGSTSSSSAFAEIVNDRTMTMTVSLSEDDISSVKVGQAVTVSLTALTGVELAGKVTAISPLGTESDDVVSYDATITVDQSNSKVLAGMSATAEIVTAQAQGVTIPSDAVSNDSVELVKDGRTVSTPVTVGLKGTDRDVITSGLKAGDEVKVTVTLPSLSTSSTTSTTSTTSAGASGFGGGAPGGGAGFGGGGFAAGGA